MSADDAKARRATAPTRVIRSGDPIDVQPDDVDYWLRFSPGQRLLLAWKLSELAWNLEPAAGLQRDPGDIAALGRLFPFE